MIVFIQIEEYLLQSTKFYFHQHFLEIVRSDIKSHCFTEQTAGNVLEKKMQHQEHENPLASNALENATFKGREERSAGDITLDILLKSEPEIVPEAARLLGLSEDACRQKEIESYIFDALKTCREEGWTSPQHFSGILQSQEACALIASGSNKQIVQGFLDTIVDTAYAEVEEYGQVIAYDVLDLEPVTGGFRAHLSDEEIKETLRSLISNGYPKVDSHYIDDKQPIVDILLKWQDLFEPQEIKIVLGEFDCLDDFCEDQQRKARLIAAISTYATPEDRLKISETLKESYANTEAYNCLVADGILPKTGSEAAGSTKTMKAIAAFEKRSSGDLKALSQSLGKDGPEMLARTLGRWLKEGAVERVRKVTLYNNGSLIDSEIAKQSVSEALSYLCKTEALDSLCRALRLPAELIDFEREDIKGFSDAFTLFHQEKAGKPLTLQKKTTSPVEEKSGVEVQQSKRGGRYYVALNEEELTEKLYSGRSESKLKKDLSKVSWDTENSSCLGIKTLSNGFTYEAWSVGGDWEVPVYFIKYWDGKDIRGYIPQDGNPWNTDTKQAFGNDPEADIKNIRKRFKDLAAEIDEMLEHDEDFIASDWLNRDMEGIEKDIQARLTESK